MPTIHPTAIVDPQAQLGEGVVVGPFAIIDEDVVIGDRTEIKSHASIKDGARIGNDVKIFQSAVISENPQDLKFKGENTQVHIGDRSTIREFVTINKGTDYHEKTVVGQDCLIMAYAHLAHDVIVGDKVILANGVQVAGHVEIGYHVTIGGLVPVHQFVKIGDHSFIGGGLRVPKDVPPFVLAMGEPLVYGGLNKVGLQRRGFSSDELKEIRQIYRILFQSDYLLKEAVQVIKDTYEVVGHVKTIIDFIDNSDRGMIHIGRR